MALHSLHCADVPLRNCSLSHSFGNDIRSFRTFYGCWLLLATSAIS